MNEENRLTKLLKPNPFYKRIKWNYHGDCYEAVSGKELSGITIGLNFNEARSWINNFNETLDIKLQTDKFVKHFKKLGYTDQEIYKAVIGELNLTDYLYEKILEAHLDNIYLKISDIKREENSDLDKVLKEIQNLCHY